MIRCFGCMDEYDESLEKKCPFCGYEVGTPAKEAYHMVPGSILNQKYVVGKVIGYGGFGVTYIGFDMELERKVAIKEYMPSEFSTRVPRQTKVTIYEGDKYEQFILGKEKFIEEARRLILFENRHGIVQIYDVFSDNATAYIVMEYVEGETLAQKLSREGKLSLEESMNIILPILSSLGDIHKVGIIHRDIAPDNIMISKDGEVKLIDFGASRFATTTHSRSLTVLIKSGYAPIEQYDSRGQQGAWTDVYALAATLYKMLTGITPQDGMERKVNDTLKVPSKCGAKISKNVDIAIMNAMNIKTEYRTQSTELFEKDLLSTKDISRIVEPEEKQDIGKIPLAVKIAFPTIFIVLCVFTVLTFTGIIQFAGKDIHNFFVGEGNSYVINLVNMDIGDAENRLSNAELKMEIVDYKYSNKISENRIISQQEEKGTVVEQGTVIHVTVSKGAGIVNIPEMSGQSLEKIQTVLDDLCLEWNIAEETGEEAPGYIVSCNPQPGEAVEQGTIVDIIVSKGMNFSNEKSITIKNYVNQSYDEIKYKLLEQSIYLEIENYSYDDAIKKGNIIKQDVQAGTVLNGNSIVIVDVSKGIEPKIVPLLVGMTKDEATTSLDELNLKIEINSVIDMEQTEGIVISQSIGAGTEVEKFSTITVDVISHGVEVPSFIGKSEEEIVALCQEQEITPVFQYMIGNSNKAISQSPNMGEIVQNNTTVTINMGLSQSDFIAQLLDKINSKRKQNGLVELKMSTSLCGAAAALQNDGHQSIEFSTGDYDYAWALNQYGYQFTYCFWASRNGITTVDSADSKLPYTTALLKSSVTEIGIACSGSRVDILVATPR